MPVYDLTGVAKVWEPAAGRPNPVADTLVG